MALARSFLRLSLEIFGREISVNFLVSYSFRGPYLILSICSLSFYSWLFDRSRFSIYFLRGPLICNPIMLVPNETKYSPIPALKTYFYFAFYEIDLVTNKIMVCSDKMRGQIVIVKVIKEFRFSLK